jgi:hypothetical protein
MVALEQRIRDTGNAFTNFNTQVLKMPTKYTEAFSGARPKGEEVFIIILSFFCFVRYVFQIMNISS